MKSNLACVRNIRMAGRGPARRRGNIVVFSAFLMILMMAMIAFAVDIGYMCTMRAQLQRAVDAAALAGAGDLVTGVDEAEATAREYLMRNPVGSPFTVIDESALAEALVQFETDHEDDYEFKIGNWNPNTMQLDETTVMPSSLKVSMQYNNLPFFFGRVLGKEYFSLQAESTAMFQPRDIMVVLDFSASMNDDSTFDKIGALPQATIEASLLECWSDLGVVYGNLPATPTWATAQGVAENTASQIPHVTVQYQRTSVYVTSTQSLTTVKLEFSNGAQQSFSPGTQTGTFTGSGGNAGLQVRKVWVKSWNNAATFGTDGEYFNFTSSGINTTLKNALGLNSVSYPYPGYGSWDAYIDHVESSSTSNATAGYRYKFGGMNLVEWWLDNYPRNAQTPDHWKCRAEPVYALKDSMAVFMDFIAEVDTNDRVGLSIYNALDGEGILESALTDDYDSISNIVSHRQAGHYHQYTNIGAGLHVARVHLDSNGRPNANKMIVLMTDGLANWRNGSYNLSAAAQYITDETALCADESRKYKVMTISLGSGADTSTMQGVADATGGTHYNVPGGTTHDVMHAQLYAAFEAIAKARPLKIVK